MGRPSLFNPEIVNEICAWIADGKTLREFCRQEGKPGFNTVYDWIAAHEEFSVRFARARECGEDQIAQECLEIAEDGHNDWMLTKFGKQLDAEHVQRSKLRIETRLKLLAKWNPKKYGEKIQQEVSGELSVKRVVSDL